MPTLLGYLCKSLSFTGFDKTFIIMANTRLIFYGTKESITSNVELNCFSDEENKTVCISLEEDGNFIYTYLDESTAIKLAKKLRTEINNIKEPF